MFDSGTDAVVYRSADGRSVRKIYLGMDLEQRRALAQREYDALLRVADVLADVPGARCPTPLAVELETGELEMEYIAARRLDAEISSNLFDEQGLPERVGASLARAFLALSVTMPLDEIDFSLRNTLIDADQNVVLIDFTSRQRVSHLPEDLPEDTTAIEVALASFLTSALTYRVRRSSLLKLTEGRRLRTIAMTITGCVQMCQPIDFSRVRAIAWTYFWRQARNRGWKRFFWFNTIGRGIFWMLMRDIEQHIPHTASFDLPRADG